MVASRVGRGGRTTIPIAVRDALGIVVGDELAYAIEGERVVVVRRAVEPVDVPFAVFTEWASAVDREAYATL